MNRGFWLPKATTPPPPAPSAPPLPPSLRLTDAEREAIEASMHGENDATVIATLRKLLERLQ